MYDFDAPKGVNPCRHGEAIDCDDITHHGDNIIARAHGDSRVGAGTYPTRRCRAVERLCTHAGQLDEWKDAKALQIAPKPTKGAKVRITCAVTDHHRRRRSR